MKYANSLISVPLSIEVWDRKSFVRGCVVYVEEMRDRVLSSFRDIEAEAQRRSEKEYIEYCKRVGKPETGFEYAMLMRDTRSKGSHLNDLEYVRANVINLAVSGLYHLWEKNVRSWLRSRLLFIIDDKGIRKVIERGDHDAVCKLIKEYDVGSITDETYCRLNELRLVANTVKHGDGPACRDLARLRPDMFRNNIFGESGAIEARAERLGVGVADLELYGEAVVAFWNAIPEVTFPRYDV